MKKFTLLELLIAIAIIGILVSILLPSISKGHERAKQAVCLSNARQISLAFMMYYDDNNAQAPYDNINDFDTRWFQLLSPDYLSPPKTENWAPEVCKCPSGIPITEKWQATISMNSKITGKNQNGNEGPWATDRKSISKVINTDRTCLVIDSVLNWRSNNYGNMTVAKVVDEKGGGKVARHLNTANVIYLDGSGKARFAAFLLSTGQWDNPFWHPEK